MPKTYYVNIYAHVEFYREVVADSLEGAKEIAWDEVYEETQKIHLTNFDVDDVDVYEKEE